MIRGHSQVVSTLALNKGSNFSKKLRQRRDSRQETERPFRCCNIVIYVMNSRECSLGLFIKYVTSKFLQHHIPPLISINLYFVLQFTNLFYLTLLKSNVIDQDSWVTLNCCTFFYSIHIF